MAVKYWGKSSWRNRVEKLCWCLVFSGEEERVNQNSALVLQNDRRKLLSYLLDAEKHGNVPAN